MKKRLIVIVAFALLMMLSVVLAACVENETPPPVQYTLTYTALEGGSIEGNKTQTVANGGNAEAVTAIPNAGFLFAGWTDGIYSESRKDKSVIETIEVSAIFVSKTKTLTYSYNNATSYNSQQNVTLSYDNISEASFVIPQRTGFVFKGWYLDSGFTLKAADENGKYFLGYTIFFSNSDTLYAKWSDTENLTYKILMVFVNEAHASLKTVDGRLIDVDYKMSLIEQKICELIPRQIFEYLNEWFEGLITFEVDMFFTTIPIGNESYYAGTNSYGRYTYAISGDDVPEIWSLLKYYRSIITTSCMNDFDYLLHSNSGQASVKYAFIHMESILHPLIVHNIPFESYLDLSFIDWKATLETYLHEFTHTAERHYGRGEVYEFHAVMGHYALQKIWGLEVIRLYLLNQAVVDEETVGIPIAFWKGEIDVRANYLPNSIDGRSAGKVVILGETSSLSYVSINVPFGSNLTVEAIPFEGFKFVGWSDGVTTAIRHDINIISYLNVTAIFVKI